MKKHTIIGTAGHIDHGKTALIRALTGIDTDRLKEEKERGITIDIGFAYWKKDVTIIDVPGHEKFIRNMVAGVNTIDFFILVVAADDGIMPQTIEHLDILKFFNIRDGIVVINKIDLVDEEWLELITDEINKLLKKYALSDLPVIQVSSTKNINIDQFRDAVEQKIEHQNNSYLPRPFRLLIDRSFTVKGFGTVVTGTVVSGELKVGEEIQLLPSGFSTKVRGLQEHVEGVKSVQSGDRAAVNLQNVPKDGVTRGDVICKPGTLFNVSHFNGILHSVSKLPVKVKNQCRVRIHVGTAERLGILKWFEPGNVMEPDSEYHVIVKLDSPVSAARHDPFLIRLHSPVITLAGGKILEINPPKIKKSDQNWQSYFDSINSDDLQIVTEVLIKNESLNPGSQQYLQNKLFEEIEIIEPVITALLNKKKIKSILLKGKDHFIHNQIFNAFSEDILQFIKDYHKKFPHKPGCNLQEITGSFKSKKILPEVFEAALKKLINSEEIILNQNVYASKDFKLSVTGNTDDIKQNLLEIFKEKKFETPTPESLAETMNLSKNEIHALLRILINEKLLIQITNTYYLSKENFDQLIDFLRLHFNKHKEIDVGTLKQFVDTSRKYIIPLFEFLDSQNITHRSGNNRVKGNNL